MGDSEKPDARKQAGSGVTWVGNEPEKTPPPQSNEGTGEFPVLDDEALRFAQAPSTGEILLNMWKGFARFVVARIWRPVVNLRNKAAAKFLDRTVDSDTFDRERANKWKKFHDGRTSSSYLQDTDDK